MIQDEVVSDTTLAVNTAMQGAAEIGFFAIGTLWFWILIAVASIIIFAFIEHEKGVMAFITFIAAMVALSFWGDVSWKWFTENWIISIGIVVSYFVLGTFWGVNKWWFFVRLMREKYDEALAAFQKDWKDLRARLNILRDVRRHEMDEEDEDALVLFARLKTEEDKAEFCDRLLEKYKFTQKQAWENHIEDDGYGLYNMTYFQYKPNPRKNKGRIMMWMMYWPWSFIWTIINDPIKRMFKACFEYVSSLLAKISAKGFEGADLPEDTVVPEGESPIKAKGGGAPVKKK